jgi:rhodanese-related sulfurtransferase
MLSGGEIVGESESYRVEDLSLQTCLEKLEAGALLLDVRNRDEWDAGHAPQALFLPLPQLKGNISGSIAEVRKWITEHCPDGADGEVVAICRSGQRSHKAAEILVANGIRACNLAGGMQAWAEAGLEMVSETDTEPRVI